MDLRIAWHAVDVGDDGKASIRLLNRVDLDPDKALIRPAKVMVVDRAEDATHMLVFIKASSRREYLVIPKRFFDEEKNATAWKSFVEDLPKLKTNYDKLANATP
jgi:hypothetical protein